MIVVLDAASNFLIGGLLGLGGLLFAILAWQALPKDRVGRTPRLRREEAGLQGRLTEWLYWDAPLQSPRRKALEQPDSERLSRIGDRALAALVARVQTERQVPMPEARDLLLKEARTPAARAFLDGRMRRAIRHHWRARYRGPGALFMIWYYLVAMVRHGRRHLYLETFSAVLKELRRP